MPVSRQDRDYAYALLRQQASQAPMLDVETERELLREYMDGSQGALKRLIASHMRLVLSVAERYSRQGVSLEDLVSEGSLGLMEAARRFDPERGTRFGTYAAWWVRAYIRRYALANRRMVPAPSTRNGRKIVRALRRTQRELGQRIGREPSREEVATTLGVSSEEVAMVEGVLGGRDVSLGPSDGETAFEIPDEVPGPEEEASAQEVRSLNNDRLSQALKQLSEREREIVRRRLLDEDATSLAELGEHFGVSRERVRQIQQRAQSKLRSSLLNEVA